MLCGGVVMSLRSTFTVCFYLYCGITLWSVTGVCLVGGGWWVRLVEGVCLVGGGRWVRFVEGECLVGGGRWVRLVYCLVCRRGISWLALTLWTTDCLYGGGRGCIATSW